MVGRAPGPGDAVTDKQAPPGAAGDEGARRGAAATAKVAPLIDCHAHVFGADMPVSADAWIVPGYAYTARDLIADMDANGILFAVLSGLSISGEYNDYMIRALREHRRLRGTAIVSPGADLYTLERMRDEGIVGIRLQLARAERLPDLAAEPWRLLLRRVRDLGWHVQVAVEGPRLPTLLPALLTAGVDLVIDHFGHPDPADPLGCGGFAAMLDAVDSGRCWVKLSGGYRLSGTAAWQDPGSDLDTMASLVAGRLVERVGTDRLLWGSDAPFVGYEKRVSYATVLASYLAWVPDARAREEIGRTGLRFYVG
jgi:predicted TIM-barrel fold metal-dependent hydrolase